MRSRTRTDIAAQILEAAEAGTPRLKIMQSAYVSYSELSKYLTVLCQNGLLEATRIGYKTTPKGLKFLKAYNRDHDSVTIKVSQQPYI
jgi:predicted transcriptional regulator